jgi:putative tryptophan/tyrosine transport system substrate-binding protein
VLRVGVLMLFAEDEPLSERYVRSFGNSLHKHGWTEGGNLHIFYRWNARDLDAASLEARRLVAEQPDAIVAHGSTSLTALRQETQTISVVFTLVSEPVANGFVASLARPGGNLTGFSNLEPTIGGKWVEIIREIAPRVTRLAILLNPDTMPTAAAFASSVESAAGNLGLAYVAFPVRDAAQVQHSITSVAREGEGALLVAPDAFIFAHRQLIIGLATQHHLPTIYQLRSFAAEGGLLSYGVDPIHQFEQAASYVDRILRGTKPADLPVQQPTKFELVINLKTARALGLDVPPTLLAQADEVIE